MEITEAMVRIQSSGQGLQQLAEGSDRSTFTRGQGGRGVLPIRSGNTGGDSTPLPVQTTVWSARSLPRHQGLLWVSNLDLVEIHLSYKDLEVDLNKVLPNRQGMGLVVHAPELFAGDHTLDLCTDDESYRHHSIKELQRVIDISRDLRNRFNCPDPVLLVTNVGGFSEHHHLSRAEREPLRSRLIASLEKLSSSGEVEIIPQTMPPFPWHFGGQRFHNLFVDSDFIRQFCVDRGCASVWTFHTQNSHATICTSHSGNSSIKSFHSPPTCIWRMPRMWTEKGFRSKTVTLIGFNCSSRSINTAPRHPSFQKSGKDIKMEARGLGGS